MSATETEPVEQTEETAGEKGGPSERAARITLALVGLLAAWGIVVAFPNIAYVIVGILLCRGWDKARAWRADRQDATEDEQDAEEDIDITAALLSLAGDGRHVLLTELRDAVGAPDTKAVRALLNEAGIIIRSGVRTPAGNGPGVHQDDIPAPLPDQKDTHDGCCSCRSTANANTNNADPDDDGEGVRVQRIGVAGRIVYPPAEQHRHHRARRR